MPPPPMTWKIQGLILVAALASGALGSYVAMRPASPAPVAVPYVEPIPLNNPPMQEAALTTAPVTAIPVKPSRPIPPAPAVVTVAVQGAVDAPGIFTLSADSRVQHGIEAAGGTTPDADLGDINLAARLVDGSTLTIPALPVAGRAGDRVVLRRTPEAAQLNPPEYTRSGWRPAVLPPAEPTALAAAADTEDDARLDLNRASKEALETLPGIGPAFAEKIIATRERAPFQSVEDLTRVPGIASKRLEKLRPLVRVDSK